jgi:hypothetical protein
MAIWFEHWRVITAAWAKRIMQSKCFKRQRNGVDGSVLNTKHEALNHKAACRIKN